MSPEEVWKATADRPGLPRPLNGWCLCGDASTAMIDAIVQNRGPGDIRLSGFTGPTGGNYGALTQQIGGRQHRFIMPLYEPRVVEFLRALEHQTIQVMLGREGEHHGAAVFHHHLPWRNIAPLLALCREPRFVNLEDTIVDMGRVIRAMCKAEMIPSIYKGVAVEDVSVSALMPAGYCIEAVEKDGDKGDDEEQA
jgi:hypothetical protein